MANPCVFCLRTDRPITREHIFAKWVEDLYPEAAASKSTSIIFGAGGKQTRYESFPFTQNVKVVCKTCNNEWMSALESSVGPILGPMVRDATWIRLKPPTQRLIATWAVKTAFMLQYLHPTNRVVPDAEYSRFYIEQQPPMRYLVWLAHRASIIGPAGVPMISASREQRIDTIQYEGGITPEWIGEMVAQGSTVWRITFTVGRVVFLIFGHTFPGSFNIQVTPDLARIIQVVWPIIKRRATWPPLDPVEKMGGLDALHAAFKLPP